MVLRTVICTILLFTIVAMFSSFIIWRNYREAREQMLYNALRMAKTDKAELYRMLAKTPRAIPVLRAICNYHITVDEDWAAALTHSRAIVSYAPKQPAGYSLQAAALLGMGDREAADEVLGSGIRAVPGDVMLRNERAHLAEKRKLSGSALAQWQQIGQQFPDHHQAHIGMARTLIELGRADEARAAIDTAMALEPKNENVRRTDAEVAEACGDWPLAVDKWRAFLELFDSKPEGYVRTAAACQRAGRPEEERALLEAVCNLFPSRKEIVAKARKRLAALDIGRQASQDLTGRG